MWFSFKKYRHFIRWKLLLGAIYKTQPHSKSLTQQLRKKFTHLKVTKGNYFEKRTNLVDFFLFWDALLQSLTFILFDTKRIIILYFYVSIFCHNMAWTRTGNNVSIITDTCLIGHVMWHNIFCIISCFLSLYTIYSLLYIFFKVKRLFPFIYEV